MHQNKSPALVFDQLFLEYFPMLFHYGLKFSEEEQLVEDCIQELFIYLYEKDIKLTKIKYPKTYLFIALRRRIIAPRSRYENPLMISAKTTLRSSP